MKSSVKLLYDGLGLAILLATTVAFVTVSSVDGTADTPEANNGKWRLEATSVRIIGGYGNNFAHDGENVRWLEGKAEIELDPANGTGRIVIEVETTDESSVVGILPKDQVMSPPQRSSGY